MSTIHLKATTTSTEHDSKWWTLGVVCIAVFMLLLDVTVVNNALPSIQKDLGSSFSDLQWVVDAYALLLAAFLLSFGSLADLVGRRRVFVLGLGVFSAASLLCGLATDPLMLNLARAIQGAGAAGMFACSAALIAGAFPPQERGTAFGIFGGTIGAAVAIGPLVGGALTEGLGWEWVFFVNVPIGIAAILIALMRVAESRDPRSGHIDVTGFATFSGGLCLLVFLGVGMLFVSVGLVLKGRPGRRLGMDALPPRLRPRRHRRRHDQPAAGHYAGRGRAARAQRHGLGDRQHVPPGRHRDGHRRARRDLPARGWGQDDRRAVLGSARRRPRRDAVLGQRGRRPARRAARPAPALR
jgi:hypothetical protein